jgi:hypothetical protein
MIRQTIIFQNYSLFYLLKKPVNSRTHSVFASQICFPEKSFHFTIPIHLVHYFPDKSAFYRIIGPVASWAIRSDVKVTRLHLPDCLKHPRRGMGPVENEK